MKIKFLGNGSYQIWPETDDMVTISEDDYKKLQAPTVTEEEYLKNYQALEKKTK